MDSPERVVYTIPEVGRMLGVNRNLAYELARTGRIPALKLGRRLVCPKLALEKLLAEAGRSEGHEEKPY